MKESTMTDLLLSLVQDDAAVASLLFDQNNKKKTKKSTSKKMEHQKLLLGACQHLFQSIEKLSKTLQQVDNHQNANNHSLSGLDELYLGEAEEEAVLDAETVWGQVDLQNDALHGILKKSVKKLGQAASTEEHAIRLLDIDSEILNDEEEEEEASGNSDDSEGDDKMADDEEEDGNYSEEDEVARRMRERMERAEADMSGSDDDDMDGSDGDEFEDTRFFGAKKKTTKSSTPSSNKQPQEQKDELEGEDPAAEELNNGFFDINEMEAFADEEEDMLPEDVWEPTPVETKKKSKNDKSFHQRQREGIDDDNEDDDGDDNDSDDEEEMMESKLATAKRKKYREDDEVEALHGMYGSSKTMGDDEMGIDDNEYGEDAVNMTAADLFGKPDKKYFHKWKGQQQQSAKASDKKAATKKGDGDDDSWDGYNFDDEEADWGTSKDNEGKAKANESNPENDSDSESGSDESGSGNDNEEDEEVEMADKPPAKLSRHERQSEKLQEETKKLEQEMIGAKPWQMVGEAASSARPVNSLLDGAPEFQVASKIAPLITEEHTASLEEVIKRRILAEDWDEVIPRELPDVAWNRKRGELPEVSQEKAKLGLGELYEREYLKKAVGYDVDATEKESEEDKAKNEMKQLFANVCSKLDALSNYHFAPRPVADEAEVRIATTPAIAMEEVLPLHVSDARGAAPEEVYGKKRGRDGILRSETELEQVFYFSLNHFWIAISRVVNVHFLTFSPVFLLFDKRPNESVSVLERRQRVANLEKTRRPTQNLFRGCSRVSASITLTRNARRKKRSPWRVPKEESRMANRISILVMVPVSNSSKNCKKKFRKVSMASEHLKLIKRKSPGPKSRAHLRCKNLKILLILPLHAPFFCTVEPVVDELLLLFLSCLVSVGFRVRVKITDFFQKKMHKNLKSADRIISVDLSNVNNNCETTTRSQSSTLPNKYSYLLIEGK